MAPVRALIAALCAAPVLCAYPYPYFPGVTDTGIVMRYDTPPCPGSCDSMGARDTWLFLDPQDAEAPYKMYYDGSGPEGWLASLATSADPSLRTWTKRGPVLSTGPAGSRDSASASYLVPTLSPKDNGTWLGYYLATNTTSPPPYSVPVGPYFSMFATAPTASGPWTQHRALGPVFASGSPGPILPNPAQPGQFWQFCTGCAGGAIGLVSSATPEAGGPWVDVGPLIQDPVENFSLYFEASCSLWFGFSNRIGLDAGGMAFDAEIVVYWTAELTHWPPSQQAVVLNRTNVVEPAFQVGRVGLPSVLRLPSNGTHLALLYDGGVTRTGVSYNEDCSVALAWLALPLTPPKQAPTVPAAPAATAAPALPPQQLLMAYYSGVAPDTVGSGGLNALAIAFFSPGSLAAQPCTPPDFACLQPAAGSGSSKDLAWVGQTVNATLAALAASCKPGAAPLYLLSFGGATEGGSAWDALLASAATATQFGANAAALVQHLAAAYPAAAFGIDLDVEGTATQLPHMDALVGAYRAAAPYAQHPLQLCALSGLSVPGSSDHFKVDLLQRLGPGAGGLSHLNMMVDNQDEPCEFYAGLWNASALAFLPRSSLVGGVWGEIYPSWVLHEPGCTGGSAPLFPWMRENGVGVGIWQWWSGSAADVAAVVAAVRQ